MKYCRALLWTILLLPLAGWAQSEEKEENPFEGLKFRSIGPAFMAGRIADIAIHPEDESIWYVAVGSGGVWKTLNNGVSWTPIFDDQSAYSTGCITIDPNNPETIWLGSGENVGGRHVGYGDGVYRSTDGGSSWQNMGLKESEHISKIIVHPESSEIIWVAAQGPLWNKGGERGLYKSEDGGKTWRKTLGDEEWTGVTDLVIDPRNPDRLYAATWQRHRNIAAYLGGGPNTALYRSEDGGETWTKLEKGLPTSNMGKIGLAISPQNPDVLYAAIELDQREGGIYKSVNRGLSWEKQSDVVSGATGPHYYQELYASPHKEGRIYLMDVRTQISEDGGKTFRRMSEEHKHSDNHAMAFKSDPNYLLFGTDGGLYESYDLGQNWRFIRNMPITQFYKLAVDDAEPFYNVYGGTQDNNTQGGPSRTDNANGIQNHDWKVVMFADGHQPAIEPGNPNILYTQWQQGNLARVDMASGEVVYIQPQEAEGEKHERYNWDAPILVSPHDPKTIYHGSYRLWKSTNRGDAWTAISGDLTRDQERIELPIMGKQQSWDNPWDFYAMSTFNTITSLAESPVQKDLLYVGTDDGLLQISENGGGNWRKIEVSELPDVPATAYVNDIKADLFDANTAYVALDNHKHGDFTPYLYKTTDAGKSWENIGGSLPARHVVWRLVQDHEQKNLLFIGTEFGPFFSVNGGKEWHPLKGGIPTIPVRDLTIQRRENDLVLATFGRSFYIFDDMSLFREINEETLSAEAKLFNTRDALWYIPRPDLSFGSGKGSQGAAHFVAENPPFGATFTYHLKEDYQRAEEKRREQEKELEKADEDIPFPGWEALAAEEREEGVKIWLTVSDSTGKVIRKISGPVSKGFHRVSWDLRYPSRQAISLEQEEAGEAAMLAPPGTYYVQLHKQENDTLSALSEKRAFKVKALERNSLENPQRNLREQYWRSLESLSRDYSALRQDYRAAQKQIKALNLAFEQSPGAGQSLKQQIGEARQQLFSIAEGLEGNPAKNKVGEKNDPTLGERMGHLRMALSYNTYGPTSAAVKTRSLVEKQLSTLQEALEKLETQLAEIANSIYEQGGPAVEGF